MGSNTGNLDFQHSDVPSPKRKSRVSKVRSENSPQIGKQKRRKNWGSQRYSIPVRPRKGSVPCSKPKLYTQTSYIGPIGFEPFSSYKRPIAAGNEHDDECFPTVSCEALGCWQTEPHSHDTPSQSTLNSLGYGTQDRDSHRFDSETSLRGSGVNQSFARTTIQKPPSPLVAGSASTSGCIPKPLPIRPRNSLSIRASRSSFEDSFSDCTTSSPLDSDLKTLQDLRKALPQVSKINKRAIQSSFQSVQWQVSLPIHPKNPFKGRP